MVLLLRMGRNYPNDQFSKNNSFDIICFKIKSQRNKNVLVFKTLTKIKLNHIENFKSIYYTFIYVCVHMYVYVCIYIHMYNILKDIFNVFHQF